MTPASTVKIMTAEIVFHEIAEGRLKLDDEFTVSEHAWRSGGAPAGGSAMFLAVNSKARVEDLIRGLVIDSGNDAAITLAEGVAGSEEAFVGRMNKRASRARPDQIDLQQSLGPGGTGPEGDAARDGSCSPHVIKTYPDLYRYFGEKEFTWNKIRQQNRNPLLTMSIGADGLKTGNIDDSGFGIVGSAVQDDRRLIVAVYGLQDRQGPRRGSAQAAAMGLPQFRGEVAVQGRRDGRHGAGLWRRRRLGAVASPTDVKVLLQRGGSREAHRQDRL